MTVKFEITSQPPGALDTFLSAESATTDQNGNASVSLFLGNVAGQYQVTASCGTCSPQSVTFIEGTTGAFPPAQLIPVAGATPQVTAINTPFPMPLQVEVLDACPNPNGIPGVPVTFAAPMSGPSGTFPGPTTTTIATTDTMGVATAPAFTANGIAGGPYNVTAAISTPQNVSAMFPLTNNPANVVDVTLQTSPPGLTVVLDNQPGQSPLTRAFATGSPRSIQTLSPQAGNTAGVQYVWQNWSDGMSISHSITVPAANTTLTATFAPQYQLNISASPPVGGTVTPASGLFYDQGAVVPIAAVANSGYSFAGWSGNVGGPSSMSTTVTMSQPQTVTANFVLNTGASPSLKITKTHTGIFRRGQKAATYGITVSNAANAPATSGVVTVTETVPSGESLASMAGSGWTCPASAVYCTRSDALNGGSSYPVITVTVNVAANAPSQVVNQVSVSGGGAPTASVSDPTTITAPSALSRIPRDFAGNGRSGAVIYDPSSGQEYTALSNGDGTYSYVPNLFTSGFDTLRTGDFNGDGKADLVLYNSQTALAYLGMGNGDGRFSFQSLFWSPGYDFVEAGDLNGDGKTDFALYNSSTGTMYAGISTGAGQFTYKYTLISIGFTFLRLADFNGDGKADILVYRAGDGLAFLGIGDGAGGFAFQPMFVSPGYSLIDLGDGNGDGKADVILYNPNGNAATGISNGAGFAFTPILISPGFTSVRLADFTGDGKADAVVYNKTNAIAYFGTGTGTGSFNFQSLFWSPGYDYTEPQDVNGDSKLDIVLYNSATGTEYTGISNGNGTFTYTYSYWGIGKLLAR